MSYITASIILLIVGIAEYAISEYQQLLAVRLQILKTGIFTLVNHGIAFIINIFFFKTTIDFYDKVRSGIYAYDIFVPFVFYIIGCTIGTVLALWVYRKYKRKNVGEARRQQLEKARKIKKQMRELKNDILTEVETEFELEEEKIEAILNPIESVVETKSSTTTEEKQNITIKEATADTNPIKEVCDQAVCTGESSVEKPHDKDTAQ